MKSMTIATADMPRPGIRPGGRRGLRYHLRVACEACRYRPGMSALAIGALVVLAAACLEALNPGNYWLLFEDIACPAAPATAAIAVGIAAWRGSPGARALRLSLMVSMALAAIGQTIAVIPDIIHRPIGVFGTLSDLCYAVAAVGGAGTLLVTLYRRLERDARVAVLLDGGIIIAASMTFVVANWMHQSFLPGSQVADLFANPTANLLVPLVSALFFASAAAAAVAALSLRVEPAPRGVWAVGLGIVLIALAWDGWIGRFLSGGVDGIEPMDFMFPAGCLLVGWGGLTWTLRESMGATYARVSLAISDWLPIVAIVGCVILDVMPRSRPLEMDPIALGTCAVVLLAVTRQRALQGRARFAVERLSDEMTNGPPRPCRSPAWRPNRQSRQPPRTSAPKPGASKGSTASSSSASVPQGSLRWRSPARRAGRWRSGRPCPSPTRWRCESTRISGCGWNCGRAECRATTSSAGRSSRVCWPRRLPR